MKVTIYVVKQDNPDTAEEAWLVAAPQLLAFEFGATKEEARQRMMEVALPQFAIYYHQGHFTESQVLSLGFVEVEVQMTYRELCDLQPEWWKAICPICQKSIEVTERTATIQEGLAHYDCTEDDETPEIESTHHPVMVVPVSENDLDEGLRLAAELHQLRRDLTAARQARKQVQRALAYVQGWIFAKGQGPQLEAAVKELADACNLLPTDDNGGKQ